MFISKGLRESEAVKTKIHNKPFQLLFPVLFKYFKVTEHKYAAFSTFWQPVPMETNINSSHIGFLYYIQELVFWLTYPIKCHCLLHICCFCVLLQKYTGDFEDIEQKQRKKNSKLIHSSHRVFLRFYGIFQLIIKHKIKSKKHKENPLCNFVKETIFHRCAKFHSNPMNGI